MSVARRVLAVRVVAAVLAGLLLLAGCGTKGPLYLPRPGDDDDNPRQHR